MTSPEEVKWFFSKQYVGIMKTYLKELSFFFFLISKTVIIYKMYHQYENENFTTTETFISLLVSESLEYCLLP